MKAICVDSDELSLNLAASVCEGHSLLTEVRRFTCARDALMWLNGETVNLAVLAVELPDVSGLLLASEIRRKCPSAAIVFLAETGQHALEAFGVHASGYLLKPFHRIQLENEVEHALTGHLTRTPCHVEIRTFGNFELLVDGSTVSFNRSKAKELLAYLVEILELKRGTMRVRTERIDCDLYRFLDGDPHAVNQFCGEYMSAYSWATFTEAHLEQKMYGGKK